MNYLKTSLVCLLISCFFCIPASTVAQPSGPRYGQIRVPVFRSKADSLRLLQVQKNIDEELGRKKIRQQKVDSLMLLQTTIYQEALTYKMIYRPGKDYILSDSLSRFTDFTGVKKVCVYNKNQIPEILFECNDLEALELVNTSVAKLPKALNRLKKLKTVHIYRNHLNNPLRLFKNKTITSLTILNENPKGLPRSYKKLKGLTRLDLAENALTQFPNGARHNKKLKEFSLQRNLLTLAGKIKPHPHLEQLALHGNQIEVVPSSIRQFRNLKKLNLNLNKITHVQEGIAALYRLEQLSFYNNQLSAIPTGVYLLRGLKEIDLFHNQIEQLDPAFCLWQNLTTLYLSHNKLVSLPENIDTLSKLEGLYVWENRLGELPESLGNLGNLKYLRANHNYLKDIPSSVLGLRFLEEIDLSHNYIAELPEEIFNYPNLKIIALVNNPWNEKTRKFIPRKVEELRAKEVFVHVSDEQ